MTVEHGFRSAAPWIVLGAASATIITTVVIAPEVGRTLLLGLIGAWIVLAVVRVVILVGFAKKFQLCLADLQNSR